MPIIPKVNPFSKSNPDTGFGVQANRIGGRFINKDGSFNVKKDGFSVWKTVSFYSYLMSVPPLNFSAIILLFYVAMNVIFTCLYIVAGTEQLQGFLQVTEWGRIQEIFFFSTE